MKELCEKEQISEQRAKGNRLIEVLLKTKTKKSTPEQLFKKAGFSEESIDEFYEQLRAAVETHQIIEERPNKTEVYLEAVG